MSTSTANTVTVTGHVYRFGTDSYTDFDLQVTPNEDGTLTFHRERGEYLGRIAYMEPTNEHTHEDACRWYVHILPVITSGYVIVPAPANELPWGFYCSQADMWKLDPHS